MAVLPYPRPNFNDKTMTHKNSCLIYFIYTFTIVTTST